MLDRKLEPEVMDTAQDAREYNSMDHSAVNHLFVDDLLAWASFNWKTRKQIGQAELPDEDDLPADAFPLGDVLDLGTGTALIPVILCKRHPYGRVMAVDMAVSMLDLAVYNVEVAALRPRIQLAQADAKELMYPNAMFDIVMSNSIIHHLPEPAHCVEEMLRVLRPHGLIFVRDLMRPADQATLDELVETYAGNESDYSKQLFADSLHAALTLDEMRDLVVSVGLPAESVQATSDRHWTWTGVKEL